MADAQAASCAAGALGEQRTAILLAPLVHAGWEVLHDRAIPGARRANADHVVISPAGRVFLVDSKLWSAKKGTAVVREHDGRLWHGTRDADKAVDSLLFETRLVARALGVPVQPVMAVHNAPVANDGFFVRDVPVVSAERLVTVLVGNDGQRDEAGAWLLAERAKRVLPPYR
ncbi:nuclease-related domain-containing protein [Streptomyces pseudovenezuelae]|uniref:nuclease-related domain-containing protein n=1 Tax=Streptomyces pseudovenezuelae TaxID=67350 RepID=UPI002E809ACF|nr:nuclease-related domain-containing protein [Streptomyces pseudovenezuelae]WUA94502.1 NERD domain-containing protein [Streptomyces pseudovenezuelae]